MRNLISNPEWDKYFYHAKQHDGQIKIKHEDVEVEIDKVGQCLQRLHELGMIPTTNYDKTKFDFFRQEVHEKFFIYWTAINPPMERLLYALSEILAPKNILGIGIFTGNPLVWSLGPAIMKSYPFEAMGGIEINKKHAKICQDNFDKVAGKNIVKIHPENGFDILEQYEDESIDLLYMDANGRDPEQKSFFKRRKNTKRINYTLLKRGYSKIKSGGYAMCHNVYQPSFRKSAGDYLKFTENDDYFKQTATIAIDEMGLELSIKK